MENSIQKRPLFNLLRMNWMTDPSMSVEPWQVEDYRTLPQTQLFERLKRFGIQLDKNSYIAFAEESDTPEDLAECVLAEEATKADEDHIYLLIFELWRRLMTDKLSLSILCDELDYQIHLYDNQELEDSRPLLDALANFLIILNDNVDSGLDPKEAFSLIEGYCANSIETFLYDFISEQIDQENELCAAELLENFAPFLGENKWFLLLRGRVQWFEYPKMAHRIFSQLIEEYLEEHDVDFELELLSILANIGDTSLFPALAKKMLSQLTLEENFQDFIAICIDYYRLLGLNDVENAFSKILQNRARKSLVQKLSPKDADAAKIEKLLR